MKQKILSFEPKQNGKNYGGEKEMIQAISLIGLKGTTARELITLRVYATTTRGRNYASIWIHGGHGDKGDLYGAGHGWAGGYGYHRVSAAVSDALTSAGVKLSLDISGVGDEAIRTALEALAAHLGYKRTLFVRHG